MNDRKKAVHVGTVVLETVKDHLWLSFAILAVVGTVVLASVYLRFLLPRKTMVSLGTAMVKGETAPKALFIVSGLYALVTIAAFWLQYVRKTKEPRE